MRARGDVLRCRRTWSGCLAGGRWRASVLLAGHARNHTSQQLVMRQQGGFALPGRSPRRRSWTALRPASSQRKHQREAKTRATVSYRWYRFAVQPLLRRFQWTAGEQRAMHELIVRMQCEWKDAPSMAAPPVGRLATFAPGLLVNPPHGLERGFVPIVVRRSARTRRVSLSLRDVRSHSRANARRSGA